MYINKELIDPLIEPAEDKLHRIVKSCFASIPGVGGVAAEVFNSIVESPMESRKIQWMIEVTDAINVHLVDHEHSIEKLVNNDVFITTLLQASQSAVRQHSLDKREMLKNAVVNSARDAELFEWKKTIFMNMIERFSVLHLVMLKVANQDRNWFMDGFLKQKGRDKGFKAILISEFPDLQGNLKYASIVWDELYREQLVIEREFEQLGNANGDKKRLTTAIAQEFLAFVSTPPPNL
ncbi:MULTISPECIES: hypothetical protein [Vibrio]|uniref:hypothetical protein n=1 Tax=Vibrio TaxID=662 RepID=UPI0020BDF975|nr:hypothetical protein [Vibrio sp. 1CM23M]MCK8069828.1 hypothetical protein [Vibrio sp. 1CM23M]